MPELNRITKLLGTGFYSGLVPIAPGTAGSFFCVIAAYLISLWLGGLTLYLFFIFWCLITILTTPAFERKYGEDPSPMVADEWAGQIIPFISISFSGNIGDDALLLLAGFLLFRFFDILKPLGINKLQELPGGYGVLSDDLLAGLYALFSLKLIILLV